MRVSRPSVRAAATSTIAAAAIARQAWGCPVRYGGRRLRVAIPIQPKAHRRLSERLP
ncbi:hypothetical protein PR001_g11096 [Phytophthora rubi]|uniref:Uncharacterized protein n=1 Tax=Phytophthora rubi TaxID=129364 RepID=A0A6A3M9X6_9STRA|nr:hypothetical protein PR002_g11230 [Phytophthora rubi]KAE9031043.1 hypothetical protein PR001_g11096 [Phytophthora rubi]